MRELAVCEFPRAAVQVGIPPSTVMCPPHRNSLGRISWTSASKNALLKPVFAKSSKKRSDN